MTNYGRAKTRCSHLFFHIETNMVENKRWNNAADPLDGCCATTLRQPFSLITFRPKETIYKGKTEGNRIKRRLFILKRELFGFPAAYGVESVFRPLICPPPVLPVTPFSRMACPTYRDWRIVPAPRNGKHMVCWLWLRKAAC